MGSCTEWSRVECNPAPGWFLAYSGSACRRQFYRRVPGAVPPGPQWLGSNDANQIFGPSRYFAGLHEVVWMTRSIRIRSERPATAHEYPDMHRGIARCMRPEYRGARCQSIGRAMRNYSARFAMREGLQRAWWRILGAMYVPRMVQHGDLVLSIMDMRPRKERLGQQPDAVVMDALNRPGFSGDSVD